MKWFAHPLVNLLVSVLVLMSLFAGVKLMLNKLPEGGIVGDVKHFFSLA
jgi:hypothetical protein